MGSSSSGFLAEFVMQHFEKVTLPKLPYVLRIYKRYVDDSFAVIPCDMIDETIRIFNEYHPRLQFTCEKEVNASINFLDLTISRNNVGVISTAWYRKIIASERYLNFNAFNPLTHKKNTVIALCDRAIKLSTCNERPAAMKKLRKILGDNNYPPRFYEPIIKSRVEQFYNNLRRDRTENIYVSAPYIFGLSDRIKKLLGNFGLCLSCKADNTVKQLYSKNKYHLPLPKQSNLVYRIRCLDCSHLYIGQTSQYFHKRIYQHQYDVRCKNVVNSSSLSQHAIYNNHNIDFENAEVVERYPYYGSRIVAESMYILQSIDQSMNRRTDIDGNHRTYTNVLRKLKHS